MSVVIEHTSAGGTLVDGTTRGDGSAAVLKSLGWRWGRSISMWFVPRSRDRQANRPLIERTAQALRVAGFEVDVIVDETRRSTAEVEVDQMARAESRAAALTAKAQRLEAQSGNAYQQARDMSARIPFGQPILADHYSAPRDRRFRAKVSATYDKAFELQDAAEQTNRKAQIAGAHTRARYNPQTVGNKIASLGAELRRAQRAGRHDDAEHLQEQLDYWQQVRADQITSGQAGDFGPHTIVAGDSVRVGAGWYRVERASAKSVTVAGDFGPCRVPYHKLYDHHRLTDETRLAAAYLNARGWRILNYAWPTDDGAELELVAMDADRTPVAFLIRSSDKTDPLALITQADVDTTHHAAAAWAATQPSPSPAPRVDALGIQGQLITHVHDL